MSVKTGKQRRSADEHSVWWSLKRRPQFVAPAREIVTKTPKAGFKNFGTTLDGSYPTPGNSYAAVPVLGPLLPEWIRDPSTKCLVHLFCWDCLKSWKKTSPRTT